MVTFALLALPAMIARSSSAIPTHDRRLPLDAGNHSQSLKFSVMRWVERAQVPARSCHDGSPPLRAHTRSFQRTLLQCTILINTLHHAPAKQQLARSALQFPVVSTSFCVQQRLPVLAHTVRVGAISASKWRRWHTLIFLPNSRINKRTNTIRTINMTQRRKQGKCTHNTQRKKNAFTSRAYPRSHIASPEVIAVNLRSCKHKNNDT